MFKGNGGNELHRVLSDLWNPALKIYTCDRFLCPRLG